MRTQGFQDPNEGLPNAVPDLRPGLLRDEAFRQFVGSRRHLEDAILDPIQQELPDLLRRHLGFDLGLDRLQRSHRLVVKPIAKHAVRVHQRSCSQEAQQERHRFEHALIHSAVIQRPTAVHAQLASPAEHTLGIQEGDL